MSDKRSLDEITAAWQQAKDAFAQSEQRYHHLVEHSLGLICSHDLSGRLESINPAAAHSLGYEPEHGVGHSLAEFLAPETRHLFDGYLQRIRAKGHDAGLMRVIARDGSERVWMYRNVLFHETGREPYVLGHAIDITDRVAAERAVREKEHALRRAHDELERRVNERTAALEQANERLRVEIAERQRAEVSRESALIEQRDTLAFLASVSEGLAPVLKFEHLLDALRTLPVPFAADWTIVHVADEGAVRSEPGIHRDSDRAAALSSLAAAASGPLPAESIVARVIASGKLTIETDADVDLDKQFLGTVGTSDTSALLRQIGIGSVAVVPLSAHGRKAALSMGGISADRFAGSHGGIVEELAHRVRLVIERIQLYRDAQEANRLKDEFLGTLSHELRTPLNAVYGWARILRRRELDAKTAHAVAVIERNAEAQMRLIDDVLDVSRIITGKMTLATEPVDLRAVLGAALDVVRPALQAKHVRLETQFDADVPTVIGDSHRLQQVFWNVLSNAVKFTRTDDVVRVTMKRVGDAARIEIADTGVGIRRDVLPFVFDRFRQADSSMTRTYGGLGLGLAIVRHVVELHGGSVQADSAGETRGATFTIDLPVDAPAGLVAPGKGAADSLVVATPRPSLQGRKVLLVEDHDDARELVMSVLAASGAEVIAAASASEALDRLAETIPDVLLVDLGLPGEDGCTFLGRVRAMTSFDAASLPAVALTAYARSSDRERAFAAGFVQYVVKPVDPEELVNVIVSVVERAFPPNAT